MNLYPGPINQPLDGMTPVFELVGADPSAGAGLDRPPGSIALRGTLYYWKVDTGPTDWVTTPFTSGGGGGGGITNVTGTDGITVTTPVAGVKNVSNDLVTGADVAQLNVDSLGPATIDAVGAIGLTAGTGLSLTSGGAGDITVTAARDEVHTVGRAFTLTAAGAAGIGVTATHATSGNIGISSLHGDINLTALDDGKIVLDAAALLDLKGSGIRIVSKTASQLILGSGANTLIDAGGALIVTHGGNAQFTADPGSNAGFSVTTDGVGAIGLTSAADVNVHAGDDVSIAADDGLTLGSGGGMLLDCLGVLALSTLGGVGDILVQSGDDVTVTAVDRITINATNLLTLTGTGAVLDAGGGNLSINAGILQFFLGTGMGQGAAIPNVTGGTVQDAELRAAFNTWLGYVRASTGWGLIA